MTYGTEIAPTEFAPLRSVIDKPEQTIAGNIVLPVGRETVVGGTWSKSEHVVLTPNEAYAFVREISQQIPLPRVVVGRVATQEIHETFYGADAVALAESYVESYVDDHRIDESDDGEWFIDVSDDRCADCLQMFSAEARVWTSKGWVCPACGRDPKPDPKPKRIAERN